MRTLLITGASSGIGRAMAKCARADGRPVTDTMDVADAARSVLFMAGMAPASDVRFLTLMATKMLCIGGG